MKIAAVLLLLALPAFAAEPQQVAFLIHQLRTLDRAEGSAVGDSARPGRFYLLAPYFIQYAGRSEVSTMMKDRCPIVRLMAVLCIVSRDDLISLDLKVLSADTHKIRVARIGCASEVRPLGEVVREIRKNPKFLFTAPENSGGEVAPRPRTGPKEEIQETNVGSDDEKLDCPEENQEEANQRITDNSGASPLRV